MLEPIQQIFQFLSGRCDHAKPISCRNARPVHPLRCLALAASLLLGASLATNSAVASESAAPAIAHEQAREAKGPGAFGSGLVPTANSTVAAGDRNAETLSLLTFDLPAQPLVSALETYAAVSGWQVVYDGALARGRQSTAVKGRFAPDVALRILLAGTGLVPRYMAADGIVLMPDPSPLSARQNLTVNTAPLPVVTEYYGRIQRGLRQTFCADSRARSGGYRIAVGLWIGPSGAVARSALLDSTGDPNFDATLDRAVRSISIGAPPPAGFAQPVVLVITPDVTRDCRAMPDGMQRAAEP
jgi:TonB family protein